MPWGRPSSCSSGSIIGTWTTCSPGLPAPCGDLLQLLADYLHDQLAAQADLPFAHLVRDVQVVDAWPDASAPACR